MAEHAPTGPAEVGAPMDYEQHRRTYQGFVALVKISVLATAITMIALALYGFGAGGFWLGTILIILMIAGVALAGAFGGSIKPLVVIALIGVLFAAVSLS
jgi:hypothetical protein